MERNTSELNAEIKTFNIFGEDIKCTKSLATYHETMEYYSDRKEPFFQNFFALIPNSISDTFGNLIEVLQSEQDNTLNRISSHGIFIKSENLSIYITHSYNSILEAVKQIKDVHDNILQTVADQISSNKQNLIEEAESKITGLSYGIIGDGLDLIAYSIDEYRKKEKQRKEAYSEAQKKHSLFCDEHIKKGNDTYVQFISKIKPFLKRGLCAYIDGLYNAEKEFLISAGLISPKIEDSIDIQKSYHIINRITDPFADNSEAIASSLKNYPCNIAAFVYAKEYKYDSQELDNLIRFLGIENKVEKKIAESKKQRAERLLKTINEVLGDSGVEIIKENEMLLYAKDVKNLLSALATKITPDIEDIISPQQIDAVTDINEYCIKKLSKILSDESWSFFEEHSVNPIQKSSIIPNYICKRNTLLDWLIAQIRIKKDDSERRYLEIQAKLKDAKSIADYEACLIFLSTLGEYKNSPELLNMTKEKLKRKKKKKKTVIAIITLLLFAAIIISIICIKAYIKNTPYRELKNALNSNVFSVQWARDPNHKVDKWDKKNIQVFAEKLGEYHTNNNIKEALKLLIELDELNIGFNGNYYGASASFIAWVKNYTTSNGTLLEIKESYFSEDYDEYKYELDEYILTWEKTDSRNAICIYKTQENYEISCIIAEYGYLTSDSPEIIIQ